jgi:uncharacterized protein
LSVELEHRFELPVGVETAWETLLDMNKVGPCFPGATLESINGDEFAGSVRLKMGPIHMTYKGKAKIVEKDPVAHRAKIEATGNAGRTSSTAAMLVTATATAMNANRTAVDLVTTLSLTGRPAEFGRGMMVEVGNKLVGQFADSVSKQLVGRPAGGAELLDVVDPDEVAAEAVGEGSPEPSYSTPRSAPLRVTAPSAQPVDLAAAAGPSLVKRIAPVLLGVVVVLFLRRLTRRKPADD